jgi:hypothetical protein
MSTRNRATQILRLEELAAELLETARQLPPGAKRHDIQEIQENLLALAPPE